MNECVKVGHRIVNFRFVVGAHYEGSDGSEESVMVLTHRSGKQTAYLGREADKLNRYILTHYEEDTQEKSNE